MSSLCLHKGGYGTVAMETVILLVIIKIYIIRELKFGFFSGHFTMSRQYMGVLQLFDATLA